MLFSYPPPGVFVSQLLDNAVSRKISEGTTAAEGGCRELGYIIRYLLIGILHNILLLWLIHLEGRDTYQMCWIWNP